MPLLTAFIIFVTAIVVSYLYGRYEKLDGQWDALIGAGAIGGVAVVGILLANIVLIATRSQIIASIAALATWFGGFLAVCRAAEYGVERRFNKKDKE